MRFLITTCFLFVSFQLFSSDEIELTFRYFADRAISIESELDSDMVMSFEGDESALPQHLRGKLPLKIKGKQVTHQKIITGESKKDGSFPIEISVIKSRKYISINGPKMDELPESGKHEGIKMIGRVNSDGSMKYVSSEGADKEFEKIAEAVFEQLGSIGLNIENKVKIGETISQNIPIQLPVNVGGSVSLNMQTNYTLNSIEENIANFDVTFNAVMSTELKSEKIDADVSGAGIMTYDIKKHFSPEDISKMNLFMKIPMQGGVLYMTSTSDTKTFTKNLNQHIRH